MTPPVIKRGHRRYLDAKTAPSRSVVLRHYTGCLSHAQRLDTPLRIAHVTDQHIGRVTPMGVQKAVVEFTNEQTPDLVAITGDFICHTLNYLGALEEIVSGFDAPVFCVLGNHDHLAGAPEVRRSLRKAGAEILDNANTTITLKNQTLQVVGIDDAYTGHADVEQAVRGLNPNLPTLGLSHIAEMADELWPHNVPLVLSGHTHAGQLTLARMHELILGKLSGYKYVHGLYGTRFDNEPPHGAVYVSAGIGASVMPLRLGDRGKREVAFFDLGLSPGSTDEHHSEQAPLSKRGLSDKVQKRWAARVVKRRMKREKRQERITRKKTKPPRFSRKKKKRTRKKSSKS